MNRASVAGSTGSPALMATRHLARSTPSSASSRILRTQSSKAKFGAGQSVPPESLSAQSQRSGRARKSSGERIVIGNP